MKLNDKQQLHFIIVGFSLLLVGEVVFAYFSWNNRAEAQGTIKQLNAQRVIAISKREQIPLLKTKRQELANIVEQYARILPTAEDLSYDNFVKEVSSFAKNTDLEIGSVDAVAITTKKRKPGPAGKKAEETANNFRQYKYRFKLSGTFKDLLQFIHGIENHSRFLQVDSIQLAPKNSKKAEKGSDEVVKAEASIKDIVVEITTYVYSKNVEGS